MSLGTTLRSARESAGITVEQLAAQTRIRAGLIRDLENGKYGAAGGNAYARGHIRVLAKSLNADSEKLIELFDSQIADDNRPITEKLAENNATPSKQIRKPLSWKVLGGAAAGVIALALGVQGIITLTHNINLSEVAVPSLNKSEKSEIVAAKRTDVSLTLSGVNGISWVSIASSSGEPIFSGMIKSGQSQTFTDNQLINAVIGNGAAIQITLNGQDLGISGDQGEVLHLQFTPDGSSQG